MRKTIHMQRKNLLVVALVVMLILSLAILGIVQTDAAAFYGSLFGSSAGVDEDTNSNVPQALEPGQIWAGKNVTKPSDVLTTGTFEVELSALGRSFDTQSASSNQYDVVFVLDTSSSMDGSKLTSMKTAANEAIAALLDDEDDSDGVFNRVAVVTFNSGATPGTWTEEGDTYSIGATSTANATNMQQGLYEAKALLNTARANATPVIILLSDGAPNRHAAYNFASGTPAWVNGTPFDANGADNSAAYTILYAKWLKTQVTHLKIYTVGFEISSSPRAQAVLNLTAPAGDILDEMAAAKTATDFDPGSDYSYADAAYTATISNLSEILPSITNSVTSSGPLRSESDLVITDTVPSQFDINSASFAFNGATPVTITPDTEYTAASGEKVLVDSSDRQVIYTIPAEVLAMWQVESQNAPNSLKFTVTLNNSATTAGTKYYTDSSCTAVFCPTFDNPYYGYVAQHSETTDKDAADYTNTVEVEAGWGEPGEPVVTAPGWSCCYSKTSGNSPAVTSVTVDGITYTNGVAGAVITVGPRNGHIFPVTVTQDTEVPESVKTHTEISFTYDPADGTNTAYSALECQYDYEAHKYSPDVLTIDYVTVNGVTYDTSADFSFTGSNGDYVVTVLDEGAAVTCFDLEFDNCDVTDALFSFNTPASKSVTTTPWIPAVNAVTEFTVNTLPTGDDTPAAVTVSGDIKYEGTDTDYDSASAWSFTQTVTEGNVTTVYKITLDGDTLTVSFIETTVIPAHWTNPAVNSDNIATLNLTETGWIILAAPTPVTTQPPPVTTQPPPVTTQPPPVTSQPPPVTTQPPVTGSTGVESAVEKLPQTGGISSSTLIGLFGLLLIVSGGTAVTIIKRKNAGKSK